MYFRWCCRAFLRSAMLRSSCGDPVVQADARPDNDDMVAGAMLESWRSSIRFNNLSAQLELDTTARWPSYRDQDEHRGATQKGSQHEYGKAHCWHPCVSPKALTGPLRPFGRLGLDLDVFFFPSRSVMRSTSRGCRTFHVKHVVN